jgi:hypothetical protein
MHPCPSPLSGCVCKWRCEQLYKALEVGYCMGLESLNENLPEIKAELVFTQKQLQVLTRCSSSLCVGRLSAARAQLCMRACVCVFAC